MPNPPSGPERCESPIRRKPATEHHGAVGRRVQPHLYDLLLDTRPAAERREHLTDRARVRVAADAPIERSAVAGLVGEEVARQHVGRMVLRGAVERAARAQLSQAVLGANGVDDADDRALGLAEPCVSGGARGDRAGGDSESRREHGKERDGGSGHRHGGSAGAWGLRHEVCKPGSWGLQARSIAQPGRGVLPPSSGPCEAGHPSGSVVLVTTMPGCPSTQGFILLLSGCKIAGNASPVSCAPCRPSRCATGRRPRAGGCSRCATGCGSSTAVPRRRPTANRSTS